MSTSLNKFNKIVTLYFEYRNETELLSTYTPGGQLVGYIILCAIFGLWLPFLAEGFLLVWAGFVIIGWYTGQARRASINNRVDAIAKEIMMELTALGIDTSSINATTEKHVLQATFVALKKIAEL